jgi:hypothetical protein
MAFISLIRPSHFHIHPVENGLTNPLGQNLAADWGYDGVCLGIEWEGPGWARYLAHVRGGRSWSRAGMIGNGSGEMIVS